MTEDENQLPPSTLYLAVVDTGFAGSDAIEAGPGERRDNDPGAGIPFESISVVENPHIPSQWKRSIEAATAAIQHAVAGSPLGFTLKEVELSFSVGSDGLLGLLVGVKAEGGVKLKFAPPE
jgi:hypothetical protein